MIKSPTPHRPPSGLTFLLSCTHTSHHSRGRGGLGAARHGSAVAVVGAGAGQEAAGGMATNGMPWLNLEPNAEGPCTAYHVPETVPEIAQ